VLRHLLCGGGLMTHPTQCVRGARVQRIDE